MSYICIFYNYIRTMLIKTKLRSHNKWRHTAGNCTDLSSSLFCRVMVLDSGKIVEFDSPSVLLNNKQGHFYAMAKDAGIRGGETSKPTDISTDL